MLRFNQSYSDRLCKQLFSKFFQQSQMAQLVEQVLQGLKVVGSIPA